MCPEVASFLHKPRMGEVTEASWLGKGLGPVEPFGGGEGAGLPSAIASGANMLSILHSAIFCHILSLSRYKWQWFKSSGDGALHANPDGAGAHDANTSKPNTGQRQVKDKSKDRVAFDLGTGWVVDLDAENLTAGYRYRPGQLVWNAIQNGRTWIGD